MNKKKTKVIDRFQVKSESGKVFTILKRQEFDIEEAFQQETREIPGTISYSTPDGKDVTPIDEFTYQILDGADVVIAKGNPGR